MIRIGSLFTGIAGLDRGVEQALAQLGQASRVEWQAEKDPYARAVLAKHYPTVRRYEDVRDVDAHAPTVDLICGGFPCQDLSPMGRRAGLRGARSGLWSEVVRGVRVLQPRGLFVENVPAVRGSLAGVLGPLAELGFDAEWGMFTAAASGAPHIRRRWFCLAWPSADTSLLRRYEREDSAEPQPGATAPGRPGWRAEPGVRRVDDGPAGRLDARRRARRLAVLGNAVVGPQAARAFLTLAQRAGLVDGDVLVERAEVLHHA